MNNFGRERLPERPLCSEDGAATAIFTTFCNIFVFAMVTNIFTLNSYRLFLVFSCFLAFSAITAYPLIVFAFYFAAVKHH